MIGAPVNGITDRTGRRGEIVIVTQAGDWRAFKNALEEESVGWTDLMPGEKRVLKDLYHFDMLNWPLKRCRKNENSFLYLGENPILMEREEIAR